MNHHHPSYPFLTWGGLHTPFMIYVRSYHTLSDREFMQCFGLDTYEQAVPPLAMHQSHIVFAHDDSWTHIADDYYYSLWHHPHTFEALTALSTQYDLFWNMIGDSDDSFAFASYQDGTLVRNYAHGWITINSGTRLMGEPSALPELQVAAEAMLPTITQALGIVRVTDPLQCRYYTYTRNRNNESPHTEDR